MFITEHRWQNERMKKWLWAILILNNFSGFGKANYKRNQCIINNLS